MSELISLLPAIVPACYFLGSISLAVYALHACGLVGILARLSVGRKRGGPGHAGFAAVGEPESWPDVVTQLPIYNEANVAGRVIQAAAAMEYPGRHTVQVLDDSDDETCAVIDAVAEELRANGKDVEVVRRAGRAGFKAGALAHGMTKSRAPLIAVFDADFVPPVNFLLRTVPCLCADRRAGFVQGRWTFLNECHSILTRAQGVGLDSHFAIEQSVRSAHPAMFMNFNGTAGIWQRGAIEAAGGWSSGTLTEDLDLSYRVQLAGWRGHYLNDLAVPGELPPTFSAYKSQQFRWAKGSMQTALRLLPAIVRADLPWVGKVESFFHLTHYAVLPLLLVVVLLAPLMVVTERGAAMPEATGWILMVAAFAPTVFYSLGQMMLHRDWARRLLRLPALTLSGMGLAAANTRAIAEAVLGHSSAFIRTPKHGDRETCHYHVKFPVPPILEAAIGLYAFAGFCMAWQAGQTGMAAFCLLSAASFFYMGGGSLWEQLAPRPRKWKQTPQAGPSDFSPTASAT